MSAACWVIRAQSPREPCHPAWVRSVLGHQAPGLLTWGFPFPGATADACCHNGATTRPRRPAKAGSAPRPQTGTLDRAQHHHPDSQADGRARKPSARRKAGNGDGGIYARKLTSDRTVYDVVWSYRNPLGGPKRGTRRGFPTRADAAAFRRDVTQAVHSGRYAAPNRTPLADYLASWLVGARLKPQTVSGYERKIRLHISPHLGHPALGDVKPAHLDALHQRLDPLP
ncbi:MAG: Integrase [Acidimicrobiaceae bacterium]|nr:Integrase [Acidimicrobiaceae bacterium]